MVKGNRRAGFVIQVPADGDRMGIKTRNTFGSEREEMADQETEEVAGGCCCLAAILLSFMIVGTCCILMIIWAVKW